jgi:hypothetical protein
MLGPGSAAFCLDSYLPPSLSTPRFNVLALDAESVLLRNPYPVGVHTVRVGAR